MVRHIEGLPLQTLRGADVMRPLIGNLAAVGDTLWVQGLEDSFRSIFALQLAGSLALGVPFLRLWDVPAPHKVGFIDTTINEEQLGLRISTMFPHDPMENLLVASEVGINAFTTLAKKVEWVQAFVQREHLEVLVLDGVDAFFDGPNKAREVRKFFTLMGQLNLTLQILVGHDHRAPWHARLFHLRREDQRTNAVRLDVDGQSFRVWFDAATLRLTPLPPVISILEAGPKSRQTLISEGQRRFQIERSSLDQMLETLMPFLQSEQSGREKAFALDWARAPTAPRWGRLLLAGMGVGHE